MMEVKAATIFVDCWQTETKRQKKLYRVLQLNNNIIFIQDKSLQYRNAVINGDPLKLRWIKLWLILRRVENGFEAGTRKTALSILERPTTTTLFK